jgi:hypothetical protein
MDYLPGASFQFCVKPKGKKKKHQNRIQKRYKTFTRAVDFRNDPRRRLIMTPN